jgi:hypothetical protein
MDAPAPDSSREAREHQLSEWASSPSRAKRIAAAWGRELMDQPRHKRAESSMKIATRFGTNNSMAVRARRFLLAAKIIYRRDDTHHYHVA